MEYQYIAAEQQLLEFCQFLSDAESIAFDTEFVSEDSYRPDLCLLQVAAKDVLAVIDAKTISDLTPFWRLLVSSERQAIAHGAREELRFCLHALGERPANLFDVQIAAGFIGLEYPASYANLVNRLLRKTIPKGETRTNWRKRPLSNRQLEYALLDVLHLHDLHRVIHEELTKLSRLTWFEEEMGAWQAEVEKYDSQERWRRMSGISNLSSRSLAVARELWRWRDAEAERKNRPPKRILRDDLIVELARRQTADVGRIRAVRGLERGDMKRHLPDLAQAIQQALDLPDKECPPRMRRSTSPQLGLLSQFLSAALGGICKEARISPGLVGTSQDVRDLVIDRLNLNSSSSVQPPALAVGWRAEVVGKRIDELLRGELTLRIGDPLSDQPLLFERR